MFESFQDIFAAAGALLTGLAVGAAWVAAITAPNASYDKLDASRADNHIRELLRNVSVQVSGLLLAAAALGFLGSALVAAILNLVAAAGFFTNRWTLAPLKSVEVSPGVKRKPKKTASRVLAVSLSLMFGGVSLIAGILMIFKV